MRRTLTRDAHPRGQLLAVRAAREMAQHPVENLAFVAGSSSATYVAAGTVPGKRSMLWRGGCGRAPTRSGSPAYPSRNAPYGS